MAAISGTAIAHAIRERLAALPSPRGRLVAVVAHSGAAGRSFVARKAAFAAGLGVNFSVHEAASEAECLRAIRSFSADSGVHGIVLQLPLPPDWDRDRLIAAIDPAKDPDCLTGRAPVDPPAVCAVRAALAHAGFCVRDFKHVVVVGRGFLVGAPVSHWLRAEGIAFSVIDIDTPDSAAIIGGADLIISGVGKTGICGLRFVRDGAGIIDFGFPPDFDQNALAREAERLAFCTMTPGGIGPILVASLFDNFYRLPDKR